MEQERVVAITLSEKEAELFKEFREFQDDFKILLSNSVFSFKNGSIVIHRDDLGKIRKIEMHKVYYKN
jgi:hypothetical protein